LLNADRLVDFPVQVPRLRGATLLGARVCWVRGLKSVLIFYERRGSRASMFLLDRRTLSVKTPPASRCQARHQYQVCVVRDARALVAVAATPETMTAFIPDLAAPLWPKL
jgi:hypothetical protein